MCSPRRTALHAIGLLFLSVVVTATHIAAAEPAVSEWIHPGTDGKLVYKTTGAGDRIMDFSHAGYMGGGVALPNVPVKKTVQPSGGEDDTALIQAAIDEVSSLPLENGCRGAVLLAPGTYPCAGTVRVYASGVVLRGSGAAGESQSTLKLVGRPHGAINVRSPGSDRRGRQGQRGERESTERSSENQTATTDPKDAFTEVRTTFVDDYVPSGTATFTVNDATGFAVGDTITIQRPVTQAWVEFMHMDDLVRNGRPQTWIRPGRDTTTERRIAAIDGNRLTVDVPLTDSFDAKYLNPPGTSVVKIHPSTRVSQVGIENLHIGSPPQPINHTQRHFSAMRVSGEDCWVRDVAIDETMNSVGIGGRRITLQRVTVTRQARHEGSSRPAEFAPNGSQILLDRCSVTADNVWFVATGAGNSGPIVLLNCTFHGDSRAESHQRWSTGMLYDNCRVPEGGIELRNRGSMGSGHGWSMGWGVIWNCTAKDYIVQHPPGAPNWMIGCIGESRLAPRPFGKGPDLPEGIKDAHGAHVAPESLYLAQLAERLGPQALMNIGY
jgi:hypothetical protein